MGFFELIFKRIESFIKSTLSRFSTKLTKIKRLPVTIAKKSKDLLKDALNFIIKKPSQLSDYLRVGDVYVAKRAMLFGILAAAAIILLLIWIVFPFVNKHLFTQSVTVNTAAFFTAQGKASVYNTDGSVLYVGDVSDGAANGTGRLYSNNVLVYQGQFEDNEYCGEGKLFSQNSSLVYEGSFSASKYNGAGKLYSENGALLYDGKFVEGKCSGEGTLFHDNGKIAQTGTFADGLLNGEGQTYDENGEPIYKGGFADGKFSGTGELYENGVLCYKGEFVNGLKSGSGTEFAEDGSKIYSGGFANGEYSGEGILFFDDNGFRVEGNFENGLPNSNCKLFDENGKELFNGILKDGEINYISYLSADKAKVEAAFVSGAAEREIGDNTLLFYDDIGCGFLFDANDKTDRIIITGSQVLFNAAVGEKLNNYLRPEGALHYDAYNSSATNAEKKLMGYIGVEQADYIVCEKFIVGNVFIKLFSLEGNVVFYEVGII